MPAVDRFLYKELPHAGEETNSGCSCAVPVKKALVASFFSLKEVVCLLCLVSFLLTLINVEMKILFVYLWQEQDTTHTCRIRAPWLYFHLLESGHLPQR